MHTIYVYTRFNFHLVVIIFRFYECIAVSQYYYFICSGIRLISVAAKVFLLFKYIFFCLLFFIFLTFII